MTPENEKINVEFTRDLMLGVIWFEPSKNGGRDLSYTEVLQAIKEKGIVSGVNKGDLEEILLNKKYDYKYVIAQGEAAENGTDAVIALNFDKEQLKNLSPKQREDGTVDFRDLDRVRNVKKGEVLATKIPATKGKDGINIMGNVLKAKSGKDLRLPVGKNTMISDDGLKLVAMVDGKLEYDGHAISISNMCIIEADVDNSTGNIDFIGSVIIKGSVHSGFKVKARDSIEVRGNVEGATLIAGGDIILSYGIQGTQSSSLKAGGDIVAKFIQNAHVDADGSVITEGIWNSVVNAGGQVKVDIGRGSIMGGNVQATNLIAARNIGSSMGVITGVQTGIPSSVYEEYKSLAGEIKKQRDELEQIEKEIIYIKTRNMTSMDAIKASRLNNLLISRQLKLDQLGADTKKYENLAMRMESSQEGVVKIAGTIYPGTKLTFGNLVKEITHQQSRCVFRKAGEEIYVSDYDEDMINIKAIDEDNRVKVVEDGLYITEIGTMRYRKDQKQ